MEASITLKAVAKKYRDTAILADLSFGVKKGTTFVLVGENGSGKSTLLKILTGLIERDAGSIYIDGIDIRTRGHETRSITGYMSQVSDLDEELTILENLTIYGELHGLSGKIARKQAVYWSRILDFEMHLKDHPAQLSYGHNRRVCFARALIHDPKVILLDEPTTGMDPHGRAKIWDVLDKFQGKKTILFTTQNFLEAERYSERIAILHDGNIKMDGTLERLIETTEGLSRYNIAFAQTPTTTLIEKIRELQNISRLTLKGFELEFYSREKKQFFEVLKLAVKYELRDIGTSLCQLQDLFIGLTDGGFE